MDPQESTVRTKKTQDLIGSRVGSAFVITGVLGAGAMGNVYRASQETIGRDVAIKFLPVEIASDATAVQRLTREARALGLLNHPGIVTTFDFGFTADQEPYLVLELVEGQNLQIILDTEKQMSITRALPIFVQICEAMSYAHSQGIIHRDLKPLNIMVGTRDKVEFAKILDFGIVKLTSESQQLTKSGEIWGSPFYMSPEQCLGGEIDNRTDIYSLGCVMFRALTGEVPHRGATFPETIARKLSEYPPAFNTVSATLNLPEKLETVVLKCLRKNAEERYATMQELRTDLLKLYPDRKESEATLTYNKLDVLPASTVAASGANPANITAVTPAANNSQNSNTAARETAVVAVKIAAEIAARKEAEAAARAAAKNLASASAQPLRSAPAFDATPVADLTQMPITQVPTAPLPIPQAPPLTPMPKAAQAPQISPDRQAPQGSNAPVLPPLLSAQQTAPAKQYQANKAGQAAASSSRLPVKKAASAQAHGSSINDSAKIIIALVGATFILAGVMATGLFFLYQNYLSSQKANTISGASPLKIKADLKEIAKEEIKQNSKDAGTEPVKAQATLPLKEQSKNQEFAKELAKENKEQAAVTEQKMPVATPQAIPPHKLKPQEGLIKRHTTAHDSLAETGKAHHKAVRPVVKNVEEVPDVRPRRRHSLDSDPNSFYTEFGGR